MKTIANLTAGLILLVMTSLQSHAAPATPSPGLKVSDLTPYHWSESDEHVRIPKALLPHLDIKAMERFSLDGEATRWLTEQFTQIYRLTANEAETVESHLAKAKHELRLEEGRHLISKDDLVDLGSYTAPPGLVVLEQFGFTLTPYEEELTKIERNLRLEILGTLGKERSEHFWRLSAIFSRTLFRPKFGQSYTFRLIEFQSALSVDRVTASGGNSGGGPHYASLDQYAPEVLKPVLKRWRAASVEYAATNKVIATPKLASVNQSGRTVEINGDRKEVQPQSPTQNKEPAKMPGPWDDAAVFVDLPKSLIPSLGVPGLEDDDTVSREAVVMFGLTPAETKAVETLYIEFQQRFEQIEQTHLTRPNGAQNYFVLRPFPEKAKTLQSEWATRLGKAVGEGRAQFLDQSIRTPIDLIFRITRDRGERPRAKPRHVQGWPIWLNRGTKEVQFHITFIGGPKGISSISYRVVEDGTDRDVRGRIAAQGMAIPNDWKHLFTVEMLSPDLSRGPKEL